MARAISYGNRRQLDAKRFRVHKLKQRPACRHKEVGKMTMRDILLACALLYAMELWLILVCRVDGRFLLTIPLFPR